MARSGIFLVIPGDNHHVGTGQGFSGRHLECHIHRIEEFQREFALHLPDVVPDIIGFSILRRCVGGVGIQLKLRQFSQCLPGHATFLASRRHHTKLSRHG